MTGLIWIQTAPHSHSIYERIYSKTIIQQATEGHVRLLSMQRGNPGIYFPGQLVISGSDEACYHIVKDTVFLGGLFTENFDIPLILP